ncbi:unnamed protein product [Angiostrongylus costaricensis]|uniref:Metalloendopeptidase n=1 Tax=Angiostrongylus costaricensis TaxID=334426 RepID=A0A0R3PVY4_ANGCS|nr:unnamed protein product [Angiostrongylus costaricensis]
MQGGEQFLHLEASSLGSCMRFEIIIHELFHTVGLDHEHSRNDRDDYVKVHYENVKKGRESQFLKCLYPPEYDIPYDYKSIMHYHQRAFTKNNGITLETLDPQYQDVIGTAKKPSPNDYLKVCALYRCGTCMGKKVVIETLPVKPTTPASKHSSCYDVQPFICYIGLLHGLLNCKKPLHRQACCKTCKKTPHFDDFLNITQFLI